MMTARMMMMTAMMMVMMVMIKWDERLVTASERRQWRRRQQSGYVSISLPCFSFDSTLSDEGGRNWMWLWKQTDRGSGLDEVEGKSWMLRQWYQWTRYSVCPSFWWQAYCWYWEINWYGTCKSLPASRFDSTPMNEGVDDNCSLFDDGQMDRRDEFVSLHRQ